MRGRAAETAGNLCWSVSNIKLCFKNAEWFFSLTDSLLLSFAAVLSVCECTWVHVHAGSFKHHRQSSWRKGSETIFLLTSSTVSLLKQSVNCGVSSHILFASWCYFIEVKGHWFHLFNHTYWPIFQPLICQIGISTARLLLSSFLLTCLFVISTTASVMKTHRLHSDWTV